LNLQILLLITPPVLLALTMHEYAHAFVAYRLGDPTAKESGRLTLNPLAHLDLLGTIMIFLVHFGWAKPVPVNPYNLKNPKKDMLWISAAGPVSNIIMAFMFGILIRLSHLFLGAVQEHSIAALWVVMLMLGLQINLALAIFNVIPIAPLDGSKILFGLLPTRYEGGMNLVQRYGPIVLLLLILSGQFTGINILGQLIWPFVTFFSKLFAGVSFQ
jgi:Zn-dependent protease